MRTATMLAICAGMFVGPTWHEPAGAVEVNAPTPTTRGERRERKKYCKLLERQLKADIQVGANGNATVFGLGGRFELNYPNDLTGQFLAAHSDLAFSCRRWRRGVITTREFEEVRERYIAVYMAGTGDDDTRNRDTLDTIMSSVSRYGFSDQRKAELEQEFKAIRERIASGERMQLDRSDAILAALRERDTQSQTFLQQVATRLAAIEAKFPLPVPDEPRGNPSGCRKIFRVTFPTGSADLPPAHPAIAQALACADGTGVVGISGYADAATGSVRENLRLSAERAAAVAREFTFGGGQINSIDFAGGTNQFGQTPAENRVVTITVSPQAENVREPPNGGTE